MDEENERGLFEVWFRKVFQLKPEQVLHRTPNGYRGSVVDYCWQAWKARAAL